MAGRAERKSTFESSVAVVERPGRAGAGKTDSPLVTGAFPELYMNEDHFEAGDWLSTTVSTVNSEPIVFPQTSMGLMLGDEFLKKSTEAFEDPYDGVPCDC